MFTRILQWIREVINKMFNQTDVKQAFNVDVAISGVMATELQKWSLMYQNQAEWVKGDVKSLGLAAAIAGEIARAVTIEQEVDISGSARADYLAEQVKPVLAKLREKVELGVAKGGLMVKPWINGKKVDVDFVQADQFYPVSFDANGNITACIFADQRQVGNNYFTRLEYHSMLPEGGCSIKNVAFKSSSKDALGSPVSLTSVDAWANLAPEATITNIDRPLFAYFRFPLANNIDTSSPLGVSCYSRAVDLIQQADRQWSEFLWEFESGERALYADVTVFERKTDGTPVLPMKRLYRALNGTSNIGDNPDGLFKDWSPTLREQNYLNGLDAILKRIEWNCYLSYGMISNPASVAKTATEIKNSQQRFYSLVSDTQKALETALEQLLYAMDTWATIGKLAPAGTYQAVYSWDDSIVADHDTQFQQDMLSVGQKTMGRVEFRIRNYGETEEVAKKKVAEIDAESAAFDFFPQSPQDNNPVSTSQPGTASTNEPSTTKNMPVPVKAHVRGMPN